MNLFYQKKFKGKKKKEFESHDLSKKKKAFKHFKKICDIFYHISRYVISTKHFLVSLANFTIPLLNMNVHILYILFSNLLFP